MIQQYSGIISTQVLLCWKSDVSYRGRQAAGVGSRLNWDLGRSTLGEVTVRSQLGAKTEAENYRWFSCMYDNVKPKKREFSHSLVCLVHSENYMLENGALCLYNIVSGSMEIGFDSFSVGQASGALSSICHGEERGKESNRNGICPPCFLSISP